MVERTGAIRVRDLSLGVRLGLTGLVLVSAMGLLAALGHLRTHYDKRDERPGFTLDDVSAQYRGLSRAAPLRGALDRGHPEGLGDGPRRALVAWLDSGKVAENYDNIDLGAGAPAEILAGSCVSCHAERAAHADATPASRAIPLDTWNAVKRVAFDQSIPKTPDSILIASLHAHAMPMAASGILLVLLASWTRWARGLVGVAAAMTGVGLALDFASWPLAARAAGLVHTIVVGGAMYALGSGVLAALIVLDLWLPRREVRS